VRGGNEKRPNWQQRPVFTYLPTHRICPFLGRNNVISSPTGMSANEKSGMFFPLDNATLGRCVPWTTHDQCVPILSDRLTLCCDSFGLCEGEAGHTRTSHLYIYCIESDWFSLVGIRLVMTSTFMLSRIGPHRLGS
jgi:hypothetical protein